MSAHATALGLANLSEDQLQKEKVRTAVAAGSVFDGAYVLMNMLATIVACYGLLANSPAVVIGAMIIAMLLGPISGVGLSLVDGNNALLRRSALSLFGGVGVVMATAFAIGLYHIDIPVTNEMMARTAPNFLDLMIALGGGAAGAFAVTSPRLSVAFVGVAIATALVPPLSTSAMLYARGEYVLGSGAFLLAFTNIVAIQFACSLVFLMCGYHHIADGEVLSSAAILRNAASIVALVVLAGILTANLRGVVGKMVYEGAVRRTMETQLSQYQGTHLAEIRFAADSKSSIVRALIRGPEPLTQTEVARLERELPPSPRGVRSELRVRFVHTSVMTANGPLFSHEETRHLSAIP